MNDQVTLVNEQDQVIGSMDKIEAHRWPAKLHRAISVYLFRRNAAGELELLIQQRSHKKITGQGQWVNTCCGNVWPGETYLECAHRRLRVELAIAPIAITDVFHFTYQVQCNETFGENEIDHVFVGFGDEPFQPNPDEVMAAKWIEWSQVRTQKPLAPWFEIMLNNQELIQKIETAVSR